MIPEGVPFPAPIGCGKPRPSTGAGGEGGRRRASAPCSRRAWATRSPGGSPGRRRGHQGRRRLGTFQQRHRRQRRGRVGRRRGRGPGRRVGPCSPLKFGQGLTLGDDRPPGRRMVHAGERTASVRGSSARRSTREPAPRRGGMGESAQAARSRAPASPSRRSPASARTTAWRVVQGLVQPESRRSLEEPDDPQPRPEME